MKQKSSNSQICIKSEIKKQTENSLSMINVPASNSLIGLSSLSITELSLELKKGYVDKEMGRTKSAKEVFANIRKDYDVLNKAE